MRAATKGNGCGLEHRTFEVSQAQLDNFWTLLRIPTTILMRVLAHSELFHEVVKEDNEIPFPLTALECGVKLPLAPFLG